MAAPGLRPLAPSDRRTPRTRLAAHDLVALLGVLSAGALGWAASVDHGDPRAAARERAAGEVRGHLNELLLAWAEVREAEAPPPGAGPVALAAAAAPAAAGPVDPVGAGGSASAVAEPGLFEVLARAGEAALGRGAPADALALFEEALDLGEPPGEALARARFGAVRAAGALGDGHAVRRHRTMLARVGSVARVRGTSVQLLATLVEPLDAAAALELLAADGAHLPPPVDRASLRRGALAVELDPWWGAVERALGRGADPAQVRRALGVDERARDAVAALLERHGLAPGPRWELAPVDGALLAFRRAEGEGALVAVVDPGGLGRALVAARSTGAPLDVRVATAGPGPDASATAAATAPLPGSPLLVSVTHRDPERGAREALRDQRLLRAGLGGLGLLVLLAAFGSRRAMVRARRLAALRSTFVASVSHDLRTPVQGILLMAEALEEDTVQGVAERRDFERGIRREAERLRRQVEDLLDGARLDRGEGPRILRRAVDMGALLGDLERTMGARAAAGGARLRFVAGPVPGRLTLDEDGVRRAVWNLFENALAHGRRGEEPAEVQVSVGFEDGTLSFRVEDSGPGVPARLAETVFEPFERLEGGRGGAGGIARDTGTGLGLAIARAIARGHGGEAWLDGEFRGGARFVLTIPAPTEPEAAA